LVLQAPTIVCPVRPSSKKLLPNCFGPAPSCQNDWAILNDAFVSHPNVTAVPAKLPLAASLINKIAPV
jgi:hypothetical protein